MGIIQGILVSMPLRERETERGFKNHGSELGGLGATRLRVFRAWGGEIGAGSHPKPYTERFQVRTLGIDSSLLDASLARPYEPDPPNPALFQA